MDSRGPATSDGRIDREDDHARRTNEDSSAGGRGPLGRRTYLQAIGAYAAGRTLLALSGRAAAAEYETYKLDAGESFNRSIGSGETFENVLIDVSADGADVSITASGSDWAIRNVGIRGTYNGERIGSVFTLSVDADESGIFENVYLGGGAEDGGYGGVFVPTDHAGTLTIRHCHVAEWPDNGIYASAPGRNGRDGKKGVVRVVESYAHNNNIAGFRLGTDGSVVRDSVVHVDGDVPDNGSGKENARGIWVKEGGTVDIVNCDVLLSHPDGTEAIRESDNSSVGLARVTDSSVAARGDSERFAGNVEKDDVDDDPDVTPPAGVPKSPKAAAKGPSRKNATDGSDGSSTRVIEVVGGDSDDDEFIDYTIETSGDLVGRKSVERGESATGGRATGATGGSGDAFVTTGVIESFDATLSGPEGQHRASVVIERIGDYSRIRFEGGNDEEHLQYKLDATGPVSATESVEERSRVSGSRARGATAGSADEFVFEGRLVSLRAALPGDAGRFLVKVKSDR